MLSTIREWLLGSRSSASYGPLSAPANDTNVELKVHGLLQQQPLAAAPPELSVDQLAERLEAQLRHSSRTPDNVDDGEDLSVTESGTDDETSASTDALPLTDMPWFADDFTDDAFLSDVEDDASAGGGGGDILVDDDEGSDVQHMASVGQDVHVVALPLLRRLARDYFLVCWNAFPASDPRRRDAFRLWRALQYMLDPVRTRTPADATAWGEQPSAFLALVSTSSPLMARLNALFAAHVTAPLEGEARQARRAYAILPGPVALVSVLFRTCKLALPPDTEWRVLPLVYLLLLVDLPEPEAQASVPAKAGTM